MLKRTQGRLLLTLLVITGLAGTLNNTSLSQKERKYVINLMKDGRAELFKVTEGFSERQLNFKHSSNGWTVKQYLYHISSSEKKSWDLFETIMKNAPNPEKRAFITLTDEQLIAKMEDPSSDLCEPESTHTKNVPFKSVDASLEAFMLQRAKLIKYLKFSTEDLRDHVVQMPFGWIDGYQFCLMMGSHSNRHIKQIKELKANPNFPPR
ncbi:MAG: DinB family protein [Bacteroidetes bacterium]|nr:DinB family protein [Bacteroidota bacterium]MBS1929454.1 DinB family protein [Bacteroidota bacterium]